MPTDLTDKSVDLTTEEKSRRAMEERDENFSFDDLPDTTKALFNGVHTNHQDARPSFDTGHPLHPHERLRRQGPAARPKEPLRLAGEALPREGSLSRDDKPGGLSAGPTLEQAAEQDVDIAPGVSQGGAPASEATAALAIGEKPQAPPPVSQSPAAKQMTIAPSASSQTPKPAPKK